VLQSDSIAFYLNAMGLGFRRIPVVIHVVGACPVYGERKRIAGFCAKKQLDSIRCVGYDIILSSLYVNDSSGIDAVL